MAVVEFSKNDLFVLRTIRRDGFFPESLVHELKMQEHMTDMEARHLIRRCGNIDGWEAPAAVLVLYLGAEEALASADERCGRCGHPRSNHETSHDPGVCVFPVEVQHGTGPDAVVWDESCGCEDFEPDPDS